MNTAPAESGKSNQLTAGMVKIPAKGKSFLQGGIGAWAAQDEKPNFENRFTYDFMMDTTEVTQENFNTVMGRVPVSATSPYGSGDAYPVYNITWFDAVLFCNARSKLASLDTIYDYKGVEQTSAGKVYNIRGLSIHLDRNGFRLPTEAEFEFSSLAGRGSEFFWGSRSDTAYAKIYAWFSDNSGGHAHPVAMLKPNDFGLYDMSGNLMEWVNDWKGSYPETGSADFAGSRDPGINFEIPVKGGAYKYGLRDLRVGSRSATYATIRSAASEYVGFRCVLAAIPHPYFSTADGSLAKTDAVQLDITRIRNLVGGREAKLVFVNATQRIRHLAYVDYQKSPPRIQEFGDLESVAYPVISPDGNWVAFGSALEGAGIGSMLYIRNLVDSGSTSSLLGPGAIPRWWVDPVALDTFLFYVDAPLDNSGAEWNSSRTLMLKIQGGKAVGAPQPIVQGGFHDGRSKDGRWLATGYKYLKVRDGSTNTVKTLFTSPFNGKIGEDTSQVCNVSMSPDSSGRLIFLDFGYNFKSGITGSYYDIHQIAFLADATGKVLRWFTAPREEKGWEDFEWSNHPDFAISASTNENNGHQHIYLVNLRDSLATRLVSGTQLTTPGLWLGAASNAIANPADTAGLQLDSLGHYNDPATDDLQAIFSNRMALFWKRHSSLEVIFTGSSHVFSGIDPSRITRFKSLNIGYPTNGWLGQEEWVTNYALNHSPKLKVLVMEAFPGWLHYPTGDFTWNTQMGQTSGVVYDRNNGYWKSGLPLNFEKYVQLAPNSTANTGDSLGFLAQAGVDWGGAATIPMESEWDTTNIEYQFTMKRTEDLARLLTARKIHLVLVNYPTNPAYKYTDYLGPYGPRTSVARQIINRFQAMEKISPFVHFYDAHDFGNHDYTDAEALNWGHLAAPGAAKLTSRLDSLINSFP